MKSEDKIKEFFKKRLQEVSAAEDAWNIPSDDVWNKAKEHFPKKKDKRRPFFLLFFGLSALLIISILVFTIYQEKPSTGRQKNELAIVTQTDNTPGAPISKATDSEGFNPTATIEAKVPLAPNNHQTVINNDLNATAKPSSNPIQRSMPDIDDTKLEGAVGTVANEAETSIDLEQYSHQSTNNTLDDRTISGQELGEIPDVRLEKVVTIKLDETQEQGEKLITKLPTISTMVTGAQLDELEGFDLLKMKPGRKRYKWEVGLSHSPFIFLPNGEFEEETPDQQLLNIGIRYLNFNIPISRQLSSKWSLSSGVSFSKLDVNMNFTAGEIYNQVETKGNLQKRYQSNTSAGSLSINDASSDVSIEFTPDANLMNGDSLVFKGAVPIKLGLIQVPLLLNYHFGKRKFEGLLHAGISIDYVNAAIKTTDLNVFKDGNLISEPIDFQPLQEAGLLGSIYFGAGTKYHINDQLNLGLSAKIDVTKLLLSRYELGVYYRF